MNISPRNILVVDKSSEERGLIRHFLTGDITPLPLIWEEESGECVLERLQTTQPHCIILGEELSEGGSQSLLARLRQDDHFTGGVVLLSGTDSGAAAARAAQNGAHEYLSKRLLTADFLRHVIESAIEKAALEQRARQAEKALKESEHRFHTMIDALPAAIYTTDGEGRLTHFNRAAVEFSGRTPELGTDQWCVSWKLYHPDGTPLPHEQCAMAVALKENRAVRGVETIVERPDGKRLWFTPYPSPLHDTEGRVVGGINMLVDNAERNRAEITSNRLAAIVEFSNDAIISKDLNGIVETWNAGAEKVFGYSAEEMIGTPFLRVIPPNLHEEEEHILGKVRRGERVEHFETRRLTKEGRIVPVSVMASPIKDARGNVIGVSKVARDITERTIAQEQLYESEERYRMLFASVPMAVFVCDPTAVIQQFNRHAVELWGREPVCGVEKHCGSIRLWLPDGTLLPHDQSPVLEVLRTGNPAHNIEVFIERPDGSRLPVLVNFAALRNAQGEITGAITSFIDITDRKKTEENLRASEGRYRALIEATATVVWRTLPTGEVVFAGNAWNEITGQTEAEKMGWGWLQAIHPADRDRTVTLWLRSLETQTLHENEFRVRTQDGMYRWFSIRGVPVRSADGIVREWVGANTDIHDHRQAEEALRYSEQLHRAAFDRAPVGMGYVGLDGRYIKVNQSLCEVTGYAPQELIGTAVANLVHPDDRPRDADLLRAFLSGDTPNYENEMRYARKDGSLCWVVVTACMVTDTEGRPLHMIGIIRDLSGYRLAEEKIRLSEIRYRRLFEMAQDGVLLLDPATCKITDANPFMTRLLGYSHAQLVGRELFEIGLLEDEVASQEMFQKLKSTHQIRYENLPLQSQEGRHQEVEVVANLYEENGHAVIQCNVRDITDRKRAAEALHESETQFRVLAESVPQFIWISDAEGQLQYVNPQWTVYTGLTIEQTAAHQDQSVFHPEDVLGMYAAWEKAQQDGTAYRYEMRIRRAEDGQFRWFLTRGIPQYDAGGRVYRWFGVTTDIEEQKQEQARSTDLNTHLQRAIAESHHRIKNNLQMLSALVELQTPESRLSVPVSELKRIGQHIRTLASLHDLLTLDSKTGVDLDTISLKAALEKLAPVLQATAGGRAVILRADEMTISLKQGSSFTLLVNELVSNALKHGKGDVGITLTLLPPSATEGATGSPMARLEVCDDGPGFPPDFDPRKSANTGLELIESMGEWDLYGKVLYGNRETGGAQVIITFPLSEEANVYKK